MTPVKEFNFMFHYGRDKYYIIRLHMFPVKCADVTLFLALQPPNTPLTLLHFRPTWKPLGSIWLKSQKACITFYFYTKTEWVSCQSLLQTVMIQTSSNKTVSWKWVITLFGNKRALWFLYTEFKATIWKYITCSVSSDGILIQSKHLSIGV